MYLLVKFFLHCDFKHFAFDVSQILVRLKKNWILSYLYRKKDDYYQKGLLEKRLLSKKSKGIEKVKLSRNALFH